MKWFVVFKALESVVYLCAASLLYAGTRQEPSHLRVFVEVVGCCVVLISVTATVTLLTHKYIWGIWKFHAVPGGVLAAGLVIRSVSQTVGFDPGSVLKMAGVVALAVVFLLFQLYFALTDMRDYNNKNYYASDDATSQS